MIRTLEMKERLLVKGFLATLTGSYGTLVLVQRLRDEILSDSDMERLGVVQKGNDITWAVNEEKEVTFGPEVLKLIATELRQLDEAEKLDFTFKPLYEMFVLSAPPTQ